MPRPPSVMETRWLGTLHRLGGVVTRPRTDTMFDHRNLVANGFIKSESVLPNTRRLTVTDEGVRFLYRVARDRHKDFRRAAMRTTTVSQADRLGLARKALAALEAYINVLTDLQEAPHE